VIDSESETNLDNRIPKTYNLGASNLAKSRSGRESMQFINNYTKACPQLDVVTKCIGMLPKDLTDGSGRVIILNLRDKLIFFKIFPCQLSILFQGRINDFFDSQRRVWRHIDTVSGTECCRRRGKKRQRAEGQ